MPVTATRSWWTINVFPSNPLVKPLVYLLIVSVDVLWREDCDQYVGSSIVVQCTVPYWKCQWQSFCSGSHSRLGYLVRSVTTNVNIKTVKVWFKTIFFFFFCHIQVRENVKQTQIQPTSLGQPTLNVTLDSTSLQQYSWSPPYGPLVNTDKFSWPVGDRRNRFYCVSK